MRIYSYDVPGAEAAILSKKVGDEFPVLFAGRGTRLARVSRINRKGRPVIRTLVQKTGEWSSERPLVIEDFLTLDQIEEDEMRKRRQA